MYRLNSLLHRDCLAAPGTTVADQTVVANGVVPNNKEKICYKCSQQGHVCHTVLTVPLTSQLTIHLQIARECPQNAEFVA